jgi:hypothetical protein
MSEEQTIQLPPVLICGGIGTLQKANDHIQNIVDNVLYDYF